MAQVLNSLAAVKQQSSTNKDEQNHHSSSTTRKAVSSSAAAAALAAGARPTSQEQAALKCPRCDSQNTKFCYYNNYSLTQPRHFCKTCRRYWTKGGALRNVPIGGGCRKNKKTKSSSSSSRLGNLESKDNNHVLSSTDIGGMKFFQGFTPAMEFQLGGLSIPRLHSSSPTGGMYTQFTSFGDMATTTSGSVSSTSCFSLDPSGRSSPNLMGFNFPFSPMLKVQGENTIPAGGFNNSTAGEEVQEMGSLNHHTSFASSIESLSSVNQDLHWKLQQQRLAMLFGGENNQKESNINVSSAISLVGNEVQQQQQKPQPILFHNLEMSTPKTAIGAVDDNSSRREGGTTGNLSTEWFFDNPYPPVTPTPTNSSSNGNRNHDHQNINSWNGIQAWNNMSQYNEL